MKIVLQDIDTDSFVVRPHKVAGDTVYLVFPKGMGTAWNKDNLILRSSVWTESGELISAGFPKFFNFDERPDLTYTPFSLTDNGGCTLMEKLDGSLLIVSKYKGELIVRTRGTMDASALELSGHEIEGLIEKYPKAFLNTVDDTAPHSLLFEWTTPNNRIVIDYGEEPDLHLIGIIKHSDYSLASQNAVDMYALSIGVKRPKRYNFNTIKEMLKAVEEFKGVEGICCYCNNGQDIRKVKGAEYLMCHRFKAGASLKNILELYFEYDKLCYNDFKAKLLDEFDYECWNMIEGYVVTVYDAILAVDTVLLELKLTADQHKDLARRDSAPIILDMYKGSRKASVVFKFMDGKDLNDDQLKMLMKEELNLK